MGLRAIWTGAKNFAVTRFRSPDRPAHSESSYRLSYPGPLENRIMKRKLQRKRDKVTRRWRKLHTKGPHDCFSPQQILPGDEFMKDETSGACSIIERGSQTLDGEIRM